VPGREGYSAAEALAARGHVVILADHLGIGESSRLPTQKKATRQIVALANHAAVSEIYRRLAAGTLITIDNQVDQTTGTVKFKAVFPNKDGALFPNQFVNARLLVDTVPNAILIPNAAVQHSPQSAFVYIVKPDSTVEARPDLRTPKVSEQALISIPPFSVTGRVHLLPERDLREALSELTGRFIPVTDATYWSDTVGEARATAPMIAFNHSRAQILAPHTEVDPWAGVNRGDAAPGSET